MSDLDLRGLNLIDGGNGAGAGGCGCGCGDHGSGDAPQAAAGSDTGGGSAVAGVLSTVAGVLSTDFSVQGMTCAHCVASVTEELSAVDGVQGVDVDLVPGGVSRVQVASVAPLDVELVRGAIQEAGYTLVQP